MLGCSAGMAKSMGLHRGYMGFCRCRCRHRGNFGCNSWYLWFWSCRSLQCGCCDIWGSVSGLDITFMKVPSHAVVDHAITGVHLVAVFWQDTYYSGRDPDLTEGVTHHNWLAGIQGCKRFASFVCLWLGGIRAGNNLFMNLEGCQVSVANSGRNGGPNLVLVQELSRWWDLGINGCSLKHQKGKLWVGATVLSMLECMFHRFYTCLCKSIWLWVMGASGLLCDSPRGVELSELCTHILRAIVRAKYFGNSVLWEHFFEQQDNFDSVALAGWKMSDGDHLWIEVATYQVVDFFQGKDVYGAHLPWVGQSLCRSEGCCSILGLEPGAGLTLPNCFFYGFVYAWPEDTSMCKQLGLGDSLMELVELL